MEKLNKLKPSISRNEELYISKEAKTENALASEGKSFRPEKINMRVKTRPLAQYEAAKIRICSVTKISSKA